MTSRDGSKPQDIAALERRLRASRGRREKARREKTRKAASPYGFGLRLVTDMLAAVTAGFLAGWGLDVWLGTSPWLVLLFTPLGMAAGILNVVRAARSAEARRHLDAIAAAAPPDDGGDEAARDADETI